MGDVGSPIGIILAAIPGVLTAIAGAWVLLRKQRQTEAENQARLAEAQAKVDAATQETSQKLTHEERDHVIGHFQNLMRVREEQFKKDITRADAANGRLSQHLDECEKRCNERDVTIARLTEFLRVKNLLHEAERRDVIRPSDSQAVVIPPKPPPDPPPIPPLEKSE